MAMIMLSSLAGSMTMMACKEQKQRKQFPRCWGLLSLLILVTFLLFESTMAFGVSSSSFRIVTTAGTRSTISRQEQQGQQKTRRREKTNGMAGFELSATTTIVGEAVENFFRTEPYMAAFVTCSFKASAADWFAQFRQRQQELQQQQEKKAAYSIASVQQEQALFHMNNNNKNKSPTSASNVAKNSIPVGVSQYIDEQEQQQEKEEREWDMSRNVAFWLYGGLYQGCVQQFIYNTVYAELFGSGRDWWTVACTVGFETALTGPLVCLPTAYIVKNIIMNTTPTAATTAIQSTNGRVPITNDHYHPHKNDQSQHQQDALQQTHVDPLLFLSTTVSTAGTLLTQRFHKGLDHYVDDVTVKGLLLRYWLLWIPVHSLTFGVVPPHYRVAFVAAVSFFWMFILSTVSSTTTTTKSTTTVPSKVSTTSSSSYTDMVALTTRAATFPRWTKSQLHSP